MLGAINNINAKSWNLSSAVLILNSFFIALALSTIAFLLDTSPNIKYLLLLFISSISLVLLGHLIMIYKFKIMIYLIKKITFFYFKKDFIKKENLKLIAKYQFDFITFVAWVCFLIGFVFPTLLAAIFNEYRTTLFQLSFVFNSIGTLLTIVVTDKKASFLSDIENPNQKEIETIINYLSNVIINRLYATSVVLLFVFISFLLI